MPNPLNLGTNTSVLTFTSVDYRSGKNLPFAFPISEAPCGCECPCGESSVKTPHGTLRLRATDLWAGGFGTG